MLKTKILLLVGDGVEIESECYIDAARVTFIGHSYYKKDGSVRDGTCMIYCNGTCMTVVLHKEEMLFYVKEAQAAEEKKSLKRGVETMKELKETFDE